MFEWLYGLILDCISFVASALLDVMTTDISFFERYAPSVLFMYSIFTAVGWVLLLGNLIFQALKAMLAGLGFETESPIALLGRTAIYGFLLLASRQILMLGLSISGQVISVLNIPSSIMIKTPDEGFFTALGLGSAGWLMAIIIGLIVGWQVIKLFFEIGERYVIVCLLILFAPLGFAMGGSKATHDIAKGYIRMFASMAVMLILNVVFLKLVIDVMSTMPVGRTLIPWCILIVALVRVARKADNIIARIGLNPAITGDPLTGRGGAMALTLLAVRSLAKGVKAKSGPATGGGANTGSKGVGVQNTSRGAAKPGFSTANQINNANSLSPASNSSSSQSSQNASNQSSSANLGGNASGKNARFGSQPRSSSAGGSSNSVMSKNNQNANIGGQSSTVNSGANLGGANMQNLSGKSSSSASMSSKTNQGGNGFENKQGGAKTPTQINTNRFGNNNAANKNAMLANSSNNTADISMSRHGQTSNMANMNKSMNANTIPTSQSQSAPKASASSAPTQSNVISQGKNAVLPAGQGKGVKAAVNNGKNTVAPANQVKNVPSSVNQGKNTKAQRIADSLKTGNKPASVNNSKNALPASADKNRQASVPHGKNPFPQTPHSVKMPQPAVLNGKNDVKPVDVKADKAPDTSPEVTKENEVRTDG
jgi:hypothetical protein